MKHLQMVSVLEMKEALAGNIGSRFPLKITLSNRDVMIRYARGFADEREDILLISETAHSLAMKILEVKEISTLEFGRKNTGGEWNVLQGKWHGRSAKILGGPTDLATACPSATES